MKKHLQVLFFLILLLPHCNTEHKSSAENWYGILTREDGSTEKLSLHIIPGSPHYFVQIMLPSATGDTTIMDNENISFTIPTVEVDFTGRKNHVKDTLTAELVLAGKPFHVTFIRDSSKLHKHSIVAEPLPGLSRKAMMPDSNMQRPIETANSLFTEELTWLEIRDALKQGKTTILIATGGVEQNGPFLPTGKHNYLLRPVLDSIARRLGNALIAPIIPFVPEGVHHPPMGHMKYPGTVSLREDTYERLLEDIALSYKISGFKVIILLGDSGGNQWGMYSVAKRMNAEWQKEGCSVLYIHEYYNNFRVAKWLKDQGINEVDSGIHDNLQYTLQIMALNPELVRMKQRMDAGNFAINGESLLPVNKSIEMGKKLCGYQAKVTAEAIRQHLNNK